MIEISDKDFNIEEVINKMKAKSVGAIVTFLGIVRGGKEKEIIRMEIEAYKEMAIKKFNEIRKETLKKFDVKEIAIIHRIGKLNVGDNIVLIVVSCSNRKEAFQACEYVINEIKKVVPIWKKEIRKNGEYWK